MAKFIEVEDREGYFTFECPGCGCNHFVNTNKKWGRATWEFNGNINNPTISPSLLVTWTYGPEKHSMYAIHLLPTEKFNFLVIARMN
ncbi:MAG: hypothetical protein FD166_2733 [Bacteroidetes bacterium]|nr:MAG: hypothetical protein FD166_2733 [Bacteroidota bacterium]